MSEDKKKTDKTWIEIPEALINDKVIEGLARLFEISPPSYLKKSVHDLFFSYVSNTKPEDYDPNIKDIATDCYCLIKFLEKAQKQNMEKDLLINNILVK